MLNHFKYKDRGSVAILQTPFSYPDGSVIDISYSKQKNNYLIDDMGDTIFLLCALNKDETVPDFFGRIDEICSNCRCDNRASRKEGEIRMLSNIDTLELDILLFCQLLIEISSKFYYL